MNVRQLLGGAAVLIVVATAFWYVAVAPSSGSGVEPNGSVQVALSATAVGTGNWVRYLITVKDLADGDFAGEVRLIDRSDNSDTSGTALPSLTQRPQLPSQAAAAGDSAYQVHVTVGSRTSRQIAILAPVFFNAVEAVIGGQILFSAPVDHPPVVPVAVLSDHVTTADALLALHYDRFTPRVAQFDAARGFPATAQQLAGYATVVIDQFDTATLSETQVRALRDFVGLGGSLVLAGGGAWRQTIAPLPQDLLPIRPSSTASLSLAPVALLAGAAEADQAAMAVVGPLANGARSVLAGGDGVPLVAELPYGTGRVVMVAFDPSVAPASGSPYGAMAWGQVLGRTLDLASGGVPVTATVLGPDPGLTALLPTAGEAPLPSLVLVGAALVVYVLLAGPLGYVLVRRQWRRPALFWAVVPGVAVVFTAMFYVAGSALQGSMQDREIQIVKIGAGQTVSVLEYHRVLFLHRGDHRITTQQGSLVAPLTLETFRATGSTCERCTSQVGGLPSGAEHVAPLQQPSVDESGVIYGSVRVVSSAETAAAPLALKAQLAVHGGRVQGTVTNPGPLPVFQLALFSNDGQAVHRAAISAFVPPGGSLTVDAPLGAADGSGAGGTAEAALLRAVAVDALVRRGEAELVGLMPPLPSQLRVDGEQPPQAGLAVLQQAVTLGQADSSLRDFERKWVASTGGDAKNGFVDTYDVSLPSTAARLSLVYNGQWSSTVEVFDWAQGTFLPVTGVPGTDPTQSSAGLTANQVRNGLVRVRLHEPRISWGTSVWVDAASGG
jgi:hypothetical protein